jgi:NH3-dependent NAD+ synthetase
MKPPSAELRPGQKDEDSLPPYKILDPIIAAYVEEGRSAADIVSLGYAQETVDWVIKNVNRMEFKRRQAAPCIRVTKAAFGAGRRMPIAAKY